MHEINIFNDDSDTCRHLAKRLSDMTSARCNVAISGGNTPKLLFKIIADEFADSDWSNIRFFWVDERMVPMDSQESNYGEFYRELVETNIIGERNLFPIDYNDDYDKALENYIEKVEKNVSYNGKYPSFDMIILGVGDDGHTASVFPDNIKSFNSSDAVQCVKYYKTGATRITLSGSTINSAKEVVFLCTGENKSSIIERIINNKDKTLPATYVNPKGNVLWYLDRGAAKKINNMTKSDFGIIGLAVMGENLALNIESRGFSVSVFNRTGSKVNDFINGRASGKNFLGTYSHEELCASLAVPRKVMLMVKAGEAVDDNIEKLLPYLEKGDIIIDGGNSNFNDTERRVKELADRGISFVGSGVSGGELGALHGPSIMPGGAIEAWKYIKPIFEAITAKVGKDNEPCCTWIGGGGAGHFVKTVHNGIEYGDMQVICEGYDIAKRVLGMDNKHIADEFTKWNKGRLGSYLIQITADILNYKTPDGDYVVDEILDVAGQKGTGKWTSITALQEDAPLNFITESVFARFISSQIDLRSELSKRYPDVTLHDTVKITNDDIEAAIYASKLISYSQGFELITQKSKTEQWGINPAEVAKIWRGGCIIRSVFLDDIARSYQIEGLETLLLSDFYMEVLPMAIKSLRKVVASASINGIPVACMSAALSYYDAMRTEHLPANLLQAQRDYFGAHTYERTDKPRGEFFHTDWTGEGGNTVSTNYNR